MNLDEQIPLERFLASLEQRGERPDTVADWRNSLERFTEFIESEGVFDLRNVPMELFLDFRRALSTQGIRDAEISRHEDRVIQFYIWLMKEEG